ncbi:MAG: hypothetical protein Q9168_003008 [Polycauliona sp. 1 TL-2023]
MAHEYDNYSDEDLDALPDGTFQELEEHAFESTQQAAREKLPPVAHTQKRPPAVLAQGLERLSVGGAFPSFTSHRMADFPHLASSDYGDMDDDMLDGEIYDTAQEPGADAIQASRAASLPVVGEGTQREQWPAQRYGALPKHIHANLPQAPGLAQVRNRPQGNHIDLGNVRETTSDDDLPLPSIRPDQEALNAQILELRRERDQLEKAKQAAEDAALAKAGEIAIIRANQSKSEKTYESKIQALQKLHQEEAARQRLEVERVLAEKQKISTEKGFLQNDLAEGNAQIRNLQRAAKAKANALKTTTAKDDENAELPTTPKKTKGLSHGDGFEDDELHMISPSKLPYRSKTTTPKAVNKRKRKAAGASPIKPLQLSQTKAASRPVDLADDEAALPPASNNYTVPSPVGIVPTAAPPDRKFELSQQVMNHRMSINGRRTFEALSDFYYPSKMDTSLSTIFLDKISALSATNDGANISVDMILIIISMWKQCVDEKFLFSSKVSTFDCLDLLKSVAHDCVAHEEDIIRFWRCMRFDFVAMVLNVVQPIHELHVVIGLLRTSVQKDTFAMIVPPNDGKQEPSERNLIDLLTRLLVEKLKPPKDEDPYSAVDIAELRLSVLYLMGEMCDNKHSSQALASSQHAVGRLVWVMNDELEALYDYKYSHEYSAELVNEATRLLFRLRTDHPQTINMHEKLKVIPNSGGVHKHLIALSRLALSEGVFFEERIEDDVVECAYEMLEDLSSPEEAEALREAFSTARSR